MVYELDDGSMMTSVVFGPATYRAVMDAPVERVSDVAEAMRRHDARAAAVRDVTED